MTLAESWGLASDSLYLHFAINIGLWIATGIVTLFVVAPLLRWVSSKTPLESDNKIISIITRPIFYLILIYGTMESVRLGATQDRVDSVLETIWLVAKIVLVTVMVYRVWHEVLREVGKKLATRTKSDLDDKMVPIFDKLGGVIIAVVGLYFLGSAFGLDMTLFAAGGAVGGLVIAFAAQDTLGNLFAGIFILADQPFKEGDRIEIKEENTWGDVVDIGLRSTKIRTRDNRLVIIPNRIIGNNAVVNHSIPSTEYRTQTHIGIAYGSDIEKARSVMIEAVKSVPGVDIDRGIDALFINFGDSSLDFRIRWWIPMYADARRTFDKVHTALERGLREAEIEIPFPQRVIHMNQ